MGREEEEGRETLDLCIKRVHQARPSRWRRLDVNMGVCMCTLTPMQHAAETSTHTARKGASRRIWARTRNKVGGA